MRNLWRGLELPSRVVRDDRVSTPTYGRFTAEPFERGFGTTIGNSLRRILLSSLEGAAVTQIKIKGVEHEFSSIPGIMEDVTDIVLNIKSLVVKLEDDEPRTMTLRRTVAGEARAGDVEAHPSITVVNKDMVLATLTEDVEFTIEMVVAKGRGYRPAAENQQKGDEIELGVIAVDSDFSPVTRVRYNAEAARVGQRTDYDRLVLEIWTNGTVAPELALVESAKILRKHLNPFVQYFELGTELASDDALTTLREATATPSIDPDLEQKLNMGVQELDLSVRANNCLESARITTVRDLVSKTDGDLLKVRSFGKTSLREVKRRLADMGLSLGMDLDATAAGSYPRLAAAGAGAGLAVGGSDSDGDFTMPDDEDEDDADEETAEDETENA